MLKSRHDSTMLNLACRLSEPDAAGILGHRLNSIGGPSPS